MTTAQVQDLRDQKGDKFVGCKTLPLLLVEKKFEANINNGFVPREFDVIEFILIAFNASSCIRLLIYRQPKQDNITYQKCIEIITLLDCTKALVQTIVA
ncbi:3805_t:CDS:2, partial [Gigaspora rosea]